MNQQNKQLFNHWQANFWAGLAIVLPAVLSVALLVWLFGTLANITDTLLIFLPKSLTHTDGGKGGMHWYWSLVAFIFAILIVCAVGQLARHYFGKKVIEWVDAGLLRVPLLNKIYSASKQVNDAISSSNKTAFKTAVLIEFPQAGHYAIGFITSEIHADDHTICKSKLMTVFIPTTPNPTSGFLILVPEDKLQRLQMPVGDGIKFIISLGSIAPSLTYAEQAEIASAAAVEQSTHRNA